MALSPDPTTAASERSSVKNRLTGSRRRGSGINRHRSRTVSKTSLRGAIQGVQGQGCPQHESTQPGPSCCLIKRGSGIKNRHRSKVSKTSLRGVESLGVGGSRYFRRGSSKGPALQSSQGCLGGAGEKKHEKTRKRAGGPGGPGSPGVSRGGPGGLQGVQGIPNEKTV